MNPTTTVVANPSTITIGTTKNPDGVKLIYADFIFWAVDQGFFI
ncbi:595_t:CDS:2 [Funneliformis mosseae]|uniref:595_t:CDS:1 n=1 Tax=Funneliformis mosseae TaxID=27381 RepID=A0A9N8VVD3_FUNMO|nr:595_t:CDS:2 [Funneliformis mosseae]